MNMKNKAFVKNAGQFCAGKIMVAACAVVFLLGAPASQGAERQTLHGQMPLAVSHLTATGRLPATNTLRLAICLPLSNKAALTNLLQQIYDPASPNYHHYLTPDQFAKMFGPTESDYQA